MAEKLVKAPGKKKDWVTPVALVGGGSMLLVGAYMILKKPAGVKPGGEIKAVFSFNYGAEGGIYVFQVSFGHVRIMEPFFDHIEGMTFTQVKTLEAAGHYDVEVICKLPEATMSKEYDAEALIRTPDMDEYDYLVKIVTKDAIRVVE
jgi:hypothetical protein